jgi:RNA recognition motif-containing protein
MPTHVMAPQMPVYAANSSGFPVNVRSGAFLTEARGIFLSGLSYSMGPNDLVALLNTVGRPVDTQLHTDRTTGRFKGTATAKFATKEEAEFAVKRLDQTRHMGKVINVRLDTNRTIVGQVDSPVVVNGSTYSRVSCRVPRS